MTIFATVFLLVMFAIHWFADFFCQTHEQATKKSSEIKYLLSHGISYTLILCGGMIIAIFISSLFGYSPYVFPFFLFIVVNGVTHTMIDGVSAKITKSLYAQYRIHDFFVVLGIDWYLHLVILLITCKVWLL